MAEKTKYGVITFTKSLWLDEVTAAGKLVQFTRPHLEGQVDLVSVSTLDMFQRDFPDCVSGQVVSKDNLMNVVNYCYGAVKAAAKDLAKTDSDIARRVAEFENHYEDHDGTLVADDPEDFSTAEDMANKYFYFQEAVRDAQSRERTSGKHGGK